MFAHRQSLMSSSRLLLEKKFLVLFSLNFAINFFYLIFCLILRNERLKLKHMQCKLKSNHLNFVSDVVVFVIRVLVCSVQWNLY